MSHLRCGAWALFACGFVCGVRAQEEGTPTVDRTGTCYTVHWDGGTEAPAELALQAVERVFPLVAATFGVADTKPATPLDVHLYRTFAGYEAAEKRLTDGRFARNLAMCHFDSKSAHVALQPPCTDATLRAIGLPGLTVRMLAWEATHAARYELCTNFRDHPDWFADGLAAWASGQVVAALRPGAVDGDPLDDTHLVLVQRLLTAKRLPPVQDVLADAIDDLDFTDRYAVRAVLFAFLQGDRHRQKLATVAGRIRSTGGGAGLRAEVLAAAKRAFGSGIDREFRAFVTKREPRWEEVFRSLAPGADGEWVQVAFPERNAVAWNLAPARGGRLQLSGELRILPGGRQQMNVLFGRTEADGFCSIAFVADFGFTVFRFDPASGWTRIGDANAPALRPGYTTAFAIEVDGTALQVRLGEQSWQFTLPERLPPQVSWGLGVQAGPEGGDTGSAGVWTNVKVGGRK